MKAASPAESMRRILAVQPANQRHPWKKYFQTLASEANDSPAPQSEEDDMFAKIGNRIVNTSHIREVIHRDNGKHRIVLADPEAVDVEAEAWELAAIWPTMPAQSGYGIISTMVDGDPRNPRELRSELAANMMLESVIAWQLHPEEGLKPVTADATEFARTVGSDAGIQGPFGEVTTAGGVLFRNSREWMDAIVTAKAAEMGMGDTGARAG